MLYKYLVWLVVVVVFFLVICIGIDQGMRWSTRHLIYQNIQQIPSKPTALVLGTSKYVGRRLNPFYMNRVIRTVQLYRDGKVKRIIVSGDRASRYYNEPLTMLHDLVKRGVPRQVIEIDNAGFRTLDSVLRAKQVFGQEHFIIVSQRFHLTRALFIARFFRLDCVGLVAKDAPLAYYWRTRLREVGARVLAVVELYVIWPLSKHPQWKKLTAF
ncbi:MAG: hypothetical protein CENE_03600 [Candidatus Celerinatantimonas neptuna]|nr:MAG: hypothetical protein CENE_03600 [Candidatus Celerinatantimonas neptuna]